MVSGGALLVLSAKMGCLFLVKMVSYGGDNVPAGFVPLIYLDRLVSSLRKFTRFAPKLLVCGSLGLSSVFLYSLITNEGSVYPV